MTIGLDIGGRSVQSLRRESRRLIGRICPAEYIALPPTENDRRLLERARVPYAQCDGSLIVMGRPAVELAPLVHVPRLPILPQGRLPQDDPLARQLAAAIVEAMLPRTTAADALCAIALPSSEDGHATGTREWEFFSRVIQIRGYRAIAIDRTAAVTLAHLGHSGFTGLALTFEDDRCAAAVSRCGRVLARAVVPRGLAWIDEQLARSSGRIVWDMDGNSYVDTDAVAQWKQVANPSLSSPASPEEAFLAECYRELLCDLIGILAARCLESREAATLRGATALVCCGPATRAQGFVGLLADALKQSGLPITIGDIRVADDPVLTVARGCLIRAELESADSDQQVAA